MRLIVCEDNEAVIKLVMKKRSMALRHVTRTHRIGLDWIFQVMQNPNIALRYVNTKQQIADMMTKAVTKKELWVNLLMLSGIQPHREPGDLKRGEHETLPRKNAGKIDAGGLKTGKKTGRRKTPEHTAAVCLTSTFVAAVALDADGHKPRGTLKPGQTVGTCTRLLTECFGSSSICPTRRTPSLNGLLS